MQCLYVVYVGLCKELDPKDLGNILGFIKKKALNFCAVLCVGFFQDINEARKVSLIGLLVMEILRLLLRESQQSSDLTFNLQL